MNLLSRSKKSALQKALTIALVFASTVQPLIPAIAFADETASVGQTYSFSNPGQASWSVPSNVTSIKVRAWGAGGSAGSGEKITDAHRSGQGGGAGGYSEKTLSVAADDSFSITVGAGGQGIKGVFEGRVGNEGGDTSFGGAFGTLRANGGKGGASYMGHGNNTGDLGFGGTAEGGDINMTGAQGAPYIEYDSNPYASNGGSAYNGGNGGSRGRCGRDGTCPGSELGSPWATDGGFPGGGGGGSDVGTGGYGANGQVTIEVVSVTSGGNNGGGNNGGNNNPGTNPVGYIDSATCSTVTGWTYDANNSSASIGVHFYTDNNVFIGNTEATLPRADVNAADNVSGDHGFSFNIPANLLDGQTHSIYAFGIDSNGGDNTNLGNSPMTITGCTSGNGGFTPNTAPTAPTVTPANGTVGAGTAFTFTAVSTDPENNSVDYGFDWDNDGTIDDYTGLMPSGTSAQMAHTYTSAGTYPVRVQARDSHDLFSTVTTVNLTVTAGGGGNPINTAPNLPDLLNPATTGNINTPIQFSVVATDPQGDNISYGFDWNNNGQNIEYTPATLSGISATISHQWPTVGTYTFSVTARDSHGATSAAISHTINITNTGNPGGGTNNPVANITSFFVSPTAITSGDMATLTWTSVDATACTASGDWSGAQATSGMFPLGAQTATVATNKTYILTCTNAYSTATLSATLTINPTSGPGTGGPQGATISTFQVNPNPITSGNGATLTWASNNATLCVAGGEWSGNQPTSGSFTISPITVSAATNYVYTISCGNVTSTSTQSVTLTVNPTTGGPGTGGPTIDFTVSPVSGLVTSESGATASFAVALASAPTANVVLPIMSSNFGEGTTSVTSLTFTPANWNLPQDVVVTGKDDAVVDGNVSYMVTVGASVSSASAWNNLAAKTVSLTNTDNDTSGGGGSTGGGGGGGSSSSGGGRGGGGGGGPCIGFGCSTGGNGTSTTAFPDITIIFDEPTTTTGGGSGATGPELVCPSVNFITSFLRKGIDNDPNEVRKLQYFLNVYEGANLTMDGDFNDQTEAAVKVLQSSHATEILSPWDVTEPTGIVYITTARYINRVFCADHPTYAGNDDLKDIIDGSVLYPPVDNSGEFDGAIGQATSTPSNIAGVFGAISQRIWDFIKDIPWYQVLILLLTLIGTGLLVSAVFRRDIGTHEYFMSFIQGASALAIASVLNVLNAVSFILNPDWFTDKAGFGLGWLLALGIANLIALIVVCVAILIALYGRVAKKNDTTTPAAY